MIFSPYSSRLLIPPKQKPEAKNAGAGFETGTNSDKHGQTGTAQNRRIEFILGQVSGIMKDLANGLNWKLSIVAIGPQLRICYLILIILR